MPRWPLSHATHLLCCFYHATLHSCPHSFHPSSFFLPAQRPYPLPKPLSHCFILSLPRPALPLMSHLLPPCLLPPHKLADHQPVLWNAGLLSYHSHIPYHSSLPLPHQHIIHHGLIPPRII